MTGVDDDPRPGWTVAIGISAVLTVAIFSILVALSDGQAVFEAIGRINPARLSLAVILVSGAFVIRFAKWESLSQTAGVSLTRRTSAIVFFSGFMLTVTPGKAGEIWKAGFAAQVGEAAVARVTGVVAAERFTDLAALAAFVALGPLVIGSGVLMAAVALGVTASLVVVVRSHTVWSLVQRILEHLPVANRYIARTDTLRETTDTLFRHRPIAIATGLSLLAWALEGLAFWVVLDSIGVSPTLTTVFFVYAAGLLAGAVSLLPGGVGVTEASTVGLLVALGYPIELVTVGVLITRVISLWYAVAIGLTVYLTHRLLVR